MKIACCPACGDLKTEREVHTSAMDAYHDQFMRDYQWLLDEYKQLKSLLEDVMWYHFETVAKAWKQPWPESFPNSTLELHAHNYSLIKSRNGRYSYKATFPMYYEGRILDAPPLPPDIIINEIKTVSDDLKRAKENCDAPYEWAPGGRLYEKMMRESDGVRAYDLLSSKRIGSGDGRFGLLLGDRMERQVEEGTEATAINVLGRVRGDRSLVCP